MKTGIDHALTFRFLVIAGYSRSRIRKVIPILEEIEHRDIAKIIGDHPANVTNHLNMETWRQNPKTQEDIATVLGIPREELFEPDPDQIDHAG